MSEHDFYAVGNTVRDGAYPGRVVSEHESHWGAVAKLLRMNDGLYDDRPPGPGWGKVCRNCLGITIDWSGARKCECGSGKPAEQTQTADERVATFPPTAEVGAPSADRRSLFEQIDDANAVARDAFAAGDVVTGIGAVTLAAHLVRLAKLQERINNAE